MARARGAAPAARRHARPRRGTENGIRAAPRTTRDRSDSRRARDRRARSRKSSHTKCGSMKRSCSAVPQRTHAPSCGSRQNHAISARTSNCCARFMRASGAISKARNSTRPSRPIGESGENSLSTQISARCVLPVTSTSRLRNSRSSSHGRASSPRFGHLRERDLQFVERLVARLVDARRLAGRADEQAGEEIGERRVALPVEHDALEQVGPAQERAFGRRRAADHDVAAAAGAGVAAVAHEFLGAEPRRARVVVERLARSRPSRASCAPRAGSPRSRRGRA